MSKPGVEPAPTVFGPLGLRDAAALLTLVAVLVGFRLHAFGLPLETDECNYAYIAGRLLAGDRLYIDVWDHQPPGIFVLFAGVAALFGNGTGTFRCFAIVASLTSMLLLFAVVRRHGGTLAGYLAAGLFALCSADPGTAGEGCNREIFMNPLVLGAVLLLSGARLPRMRALLGAGVLIGLGSTIKTVMAAQWAMLALWVAATAWRRHQPAGRLPCALRELGALALGPAAVWLATFGYLAITGRLADFWEAAFAFNVTYGDTSAAYCQRFVDFFRAPVHRYVFEGTWPIWIAAAAAVPTLLFLKAPIRTPLPLGGEGRVRGKNAGIRPSPNPSLDGRGVMLDAPAGSNNTSATICEKPLPSRRGSLLLKLLTWARKPGGSLTGRRIGTPPPVENRCHTNPCHTNPCHTNPDALHQTASRGCWLLLCYLLGSYWAVCLPGQLWPHYYYLMLPPLIVVVAASVGRLAESARGPSIRVTAILAAAAVVLAVLIVQVRVYLGVPTLQLTDKRYDSRDLWGWVQAQNVGRVTDPQDAVLVYGHDVGVYYYSGRRCASRYTMVRALGQEHPGFEKRRAILLEEVRSRRPRVVLQLDEPFPALLAYLEDNYLLVGVDFHDRRPDEPVMLALMDKSRPIKQIDWDWHRSSLLGAP